MREYALESLDEHRLLLEDTTLVWIPPGLCDILAGLDVEQRLSGNLPECRYLLLAACIYYLTLEMGFTAIPADEGHRVSYGFNLHNVRNQSLPANFMQSGFFRATLYMNGDSTGFILVGIKGSESISLTMTSPGAAGGSVELNISRYVPHVNRPFASSFRHLNDLSLQVKNAFYFATLQVLPLKVPSFRSFVDMDVLYSVMPRKTLISISHTCIEHHNSVMSYFARRNARRRAAEAQQLCRRQ